ncbi:MAG: FlgD immunoglobulin-like domain containing protein [bacterium]
MKTRHRITTRASFAAGILALVVASAAQAITPSAIHDLEIAGPSAWEPAMSAELTSGRGENAALDAFGARYGGTWRMIRNEATGTASIVYGSGIVLAADGDVADAAEAEALSRAFIDENLELFGVTSADLELGDAVFGMNKWGVNFHQVYSGVRIYRSTVTLIMTKNGRLSAFRSNAYPDAAVIMTPSVSRDAAAAIAKNGLGFVAVRDTEEGSSLIILPEASPSGVALRLAHKIDLKTQQPFGLWSTYVDARDGRVLWRDNNYESFDITGTVRGVTPEFNVCDGLQTLDNRNQRVKVVGVATSDATDSLSGAFVLSVPDSIPTLVDFRLVGRAPTNWIRVTNVDGPEAADTVLATPGVDVAFTWDDSNSRLDERSAWVHANRAHDFIKNVDLTFTGMDFQAFMDVNTPPGQDGCPGNAFWLGGGAVFCAAGGGSNNTGEIADVVYHEYGHGVNSTVYNGFGFNGALSEGQADVIANFINEDPIIGDGFFSCGVGIRNSSNAFTLADTLTMTEIHERGQIIAGFWWDLRGRLIESHNTIVSKSPDNAGKLLTHELWHWTRRLGKPFNEIEVLQDLFIVDDDDGNLDNGTPNFADICAVATAKGFTCPTITAGVAITHGGLMSTTDESNARTVNATVASLSGGIDPSTVELAYRVNGGAFTTVGMTDNGGGAFSASIPAQAQPAVVEYYIAASDSTGQASFSPTAAQDATPDTSGTATPASFNRYHTYDVCKIYDPCETGAGWTPHAAGSTAVGGVWALGAPTATLAQPGYDMTPDTGVNCFATGVTSGNVNKGFTTLLSPVWNLAGEDSVVAKYRRWWVTELDSDLSRFREDYLRVDVSNDSGQTWVTIEDTKDGLESWQERSVNLTEVFGALGNVRFSFTAYDTGAAGTNEALVDEIRISAKSTATAVPGGIGVDIATPARSALHANEPNPFNPSTLIRYDLAREGAVAITVYNPSGQKVRTLVSGRERAGRHTAAWDGRNDRGEPVSSGMYVYRMETPELSASRKMMLVK